jgi:RNA polymerase sigma-70 factor (ECF subfamily)
MNEDLAMEPMPELDERKINVQIIQNAISELPEGYRVVFSLYAIEGYDHEEISEIMGVSVSTSKSQYHRAKKKLKEIILQSNDMESLYIH